MAYLCLPPKKLLWSCQIGLNKLIAFFLTRRTVIKVILVNPFVMKPMTHLTYMTYLTRMTCMT